MFSKSKINEPGPKTDDKPRTAPAADAPQAPRAEQGGTEFKASSPKAKPPASVLSTDLQVTGNLKTTGDIQVEGTVEGDIRAHLLTIGESATMASESALLGTPAIYMDEIGRGYTDEEEKYGLVFNFKDPARDQERAIAKGTELLADPGTKETMRKNRRIFLQNKIDPTAFMVWFIENYPQSFQTMRDNPDYQYRFR